MDIGIGLPATIRGVDGRTVVEWARGAEQSGFSSLGVIDRIAYDNYEPIVALAAAAAVTERIRLMTTVLLGPLRTNHTLFAKQTASLDRLCGGRLVLGLGVGRRESDYVACGTDYHDRGAGLDALLDRLAEVWRDGADAVGPQPSSEGGPTVVLGGASPAAYRRVAQRGTPWIAAGGMGDVFRTGVADVTKEWAAAGRDGRPRTYALGYFALGEDARPAADRYLRDYYGFLGPGADVVAAGALVTAEEVARRVNDLADADCDELILFPCQPEPHQVALLADAVAR